MNPVTADYPKPARNHRANSIITLLRFDRYDRPIIGGRSDFDQEWMQLNIWKLISNRELRWLFPTAARLGKLLIREYVISSCTAVSLPN